MSDNQMKILQRLEAGEITAEEALAMMSQYSGPTPAPTGQNQRQQDSRQASQHNNAHNRSHESYDPYDEGSWIDGIVGWVGEVIEGISNSVSDMDVSFSLSDIFSGSHKRTEDFTSQPLTQGLAQLELSGKNDKIEIYAHDGDCVQIRCDYDARHPDSYVQFSDGNGQVALWYDDKAMRSVKVLCYVPRVKIGHIHAVNKNGRIRVADVVAGEISLHSKNDKINLESVTCHSLTAITQNDNIKAVAVTGENIYLETTNSKITAEDIHAASLILKTTNAGIKTDSIDAANLVMNTTNSSLKLEDTLMNTSEFWESERTIEAYTTNDSIKLSVPGGIGLNIEANTTSGKAVSEIPLYKTESSSKSRLVGESVDYATAGRRLRVRLGTTNSSVKIFAV